MSTPASRFTRMDSFGLWRVRVFTSIEPLDHYVVALDEAAVRVLMTTERIGQGTVPPEVTRLDYDPLDRMWIQAL